MRSSLLILLVLGFYLPWFANSVVHAQSKVVVVPLGSGTELKPIPLSDVFSVRMAFGQTSDIRPLFTTNSTFAYVITSMHVSYRANFPANRDNVAVRLRSNSSLLRSWYVPNDTYNTIDFGIGYLIDSDSSQDWSIDVFDRGGYGTGIANFIYVEFFGYRVRK